MTSFTVVLDLGAALGPITGYALEQEIGLNNLFWLAAVVCLVLTIAWILPGKGQTKQSMVNHM